jgi:enterochelin esterase-like enzyme
MTRLDRAIVLAMLLASCGGSSNAPAPGVGGGSGGGAGDDTGGSGGGGSGGTATQPDAAGAGTGGHVPDMTAPADAEAAPADAGVAPGDVATVATDPGSEGDGNFMIGPAYMPAPEYTAKPGVPAGTVITFQMKSTDSKFFPGLNGPFTRNVAVYVPKQYAAGTAAPFIIAQDGKNWVPRLQASLDNLIAAGKVPAMVAIMIDNGGGDSKGSERGLEYDTVSGKYAEFVEAEVLPRVEMEAKVMLTHDPDGRATLGGSSGGAAAFSMGWFHPELYHRILTYSGTYVNQQSPTNPMLPHGAWEYHEHLIPQSDPKPLRVWLECGSNDNGAGSSAAGLHNWVLANQNMAKVLAAKHYHYRFEYAQGAGHVDGKAVAQTLPEALVWLWRGYPLH